MLPYWKIVRGGWEDSTRMSKYVVGRWEQKRSEVVSLL